MVPHGPRPGGHVCHISYDGKFARIVLSIPFDLRLGIHVTCNSHSRYDFPFFIHNQIASTSQDATDHDNCRILNSMTNKKSSVSDRAVASNGEVFSVTMVAADVFLYRVPTKRFQFFLGNVPGFSNSKFSHFRCGLLRRLTETSKKNILIIFYTFF